MKPLNQIVTKDWEITATNGDHFAIKRGEKYLTSPVREEDQTVMVFSNFWVRVPASHFVEDRRKAI